jgi:hypothetical protein
LHSVVASVQVADEITQNRRATEQNRAAAAAEQNSSGAAPRLSPASSPSSFTIQSHTIFNFPLNIPIFPVLSSQTHPSSYSSNMSSNLQASHGVSSSAMESQIKNGGKQLKTHVTR